MRDAVAAALRRIALARRIPAGAACEHCGFRDARCLHRFGRYWRCYRCGNIARGQAVFEFDHLLGRRVHSATAAIEVTLHRIVTVIRMDIPDGVRHPAPDDSTALVRGLIWSQDSFDQAVEAVMNGSPNPQVMRSVLDEWVRTGGLHNVLGLPVRSRGRGR